MANSDKEKWERMARSMYRYGTIEPPVEDPKIIEVTDFKIVTTLEFSSLIPNPSTLPGSKLLELYLFMSAGNNGGMLDILRTIIPKEKINEFNALSLEDALDVLNAWLGR
jgi:hypothetical protein